MSEGDVMLLKMAVQPARLTQRTSTRVVLTLENTSNDVLTSVRLALGFERVLLLAGDKVLNISRLLPGRVVEEEFEVRADEEGHGVFSVRDISYRDSQGRIREAPNQEFVFTIAKRQVPASPPRSTASRRPQRVFYSYAHEDKDLCERLRRHLSALRKQGFISEWHDREILPGSEWRGEINDHLKGANIVLLLISSDFLASEYCYDVEMQEALKMHREKKSRVIPIILRACDWHLSPFAELQALPKDGIPIRSRHWHDEDEALSDVANGIRRLVG